jgi:hypothetical protein
MEGVQVFKNIKFYYISLFLSSLSFAGRGRGAGLTRKEKIPYMDSQSKVSEVLL